MFTLTLLVTLLAAAAMPFVYRMHGGGLLDLPWKLDEIIIAGFVTGVLSFYYDNPYYLALTFLWVAVLKLKGHGQWMTLKFNERFVKKINAEDLDIFVRPFFGKDPRVEVSKFTNKPNIVRAVERYGNEKLYYRCLFGLFVSGMSVMLLPAIFVAVLVSPVIGVGIALSAGLFKSLGYVLGWYIYPEGTMPNQKFEDLNEATEIGEFVAGVGVSVGLLLTLFLI